MFSLQAAQMQKQAYEAEHKHKKNKKKWQRLKPAQQEVERNRRLRAQLASLGTNMSSQGVALGTSASVLALADDERKTG